MKIIKKLCLALLAVLFVGVFLRLVAAAGEMVAFSLFLAIVIMLAAVLIVFQLLLSAFLKSQKKAD